MQKVLNRASRRTARSGLASRSSLLGAALLVGAVSFVSTGALSAPQAEVSIGDARTTIEEWVETRRLISKERRDWALRRELLEERKEVVRDEIESLRGRIAQADTEIAEADVKRADLIAENEGLKEASAVLAEEVVELEQRTRSLLARLPDPVSASVKPLKQRIPDDPDDTKLSLSDRFLNVVGILNLVTKFNRDVTLTSEVRDLPDGTSAEVAAFYVGLGQGYYVGVNGTVAGVGTASEDDWVWTPSNEHAEAIARAIAILEGEQADFVQLPFRID